MVSSTAVFEIIIVTVRLLSKNITRKHIKKQGKILIPWMGFEPMIIAFLRSKAVCVALHLTVTGTGTEPRTLTISDRKTSLVRAMKFL